MKHGRFNLLLACAALCMPAPALAQLPATQLTSVFPPGGKQGTAVEVTIAGNDIDDVEKLIFNHAGLKATPKMSPATALEPARSIVNEFTVTISDDVAPGIYEVRAQGRFG